MLPYITNNNVNSVLKILAKEILVTWITRHIIFTSIDDEKIVKVYKLIILILIFINNHNY